MASILVIVKHGSKKYELELDPSENGETFKYQIFTVSGVEPERQKVIIKGKQLADDADLSTLDIKPKAQMTLIGTPSGNNVDIVKPKEKMRFAEDMTEAEMAKQEGAIPAGLQNLGNTCYMNSTLQVMRAIPELQNSLQIYKPAPSAGDSSSLSDLSRFGLSGLGASTDLTASLRDLFKQMSETQEGFPPITFLHALRQNFPQFAERSRTGQGYAQQDAEEAWTNVVGVLKQKLRIDRPGSESGEGSSSSSNSVSFVDEYMGGKFERVEEPVDEEAIAAGEKAQKLGEDPFYVLPCHISKDVAHLRDALTTSLSEPREKTSPTLERNAQYEVKSRISRLPKYLPLHFVRFFWKRDVNKKAKIMRKVTFPHELDCVEYCTDELKSMLIPIRDKIRELRKEEVDVERSRKRQRRMKKAEEADTERKLKGTGPDDEATLAAEKKESDPSTSKADGASADVEMTDAEKAETYKTDEQLEAEREEQILNAKRTLLEAVDPKLLTDKTANHTGLYELIGLVTHQGASADSGHYTAYVKQEAKSKRKRDEDGSAGAAAEGDDDSKWWWFNDEKVSEVDAEKIETLAGGGESHSALILLYRAVELPTLSEKELKGKDSTMETA